MSSFSSEAVSSQKKLNSTWNWAMEYALSFTFFPVEWSRQWKGMQDGSLHADMVYRSEPHRAVTLAFNNTRPGGRA